MKRYISIALMIMITIGVIMVPFFAVADEILFRGVPWGVNPAEARKKIDNPDLYMRTKYTTGFIGYPSKTVERLMDRSKNVLYGNPEFFVQEEGTVRFVGLFISDNPKVGGYDIQSVDMVFASDIQDGMVNDDENLSHFAIATYTFNILDGKNAYKDLKTKLSSLYGEGKEIGGNYDGTLFYDGKAHDYSTHTDTITFTGDDGTHALLVCIESVAADDPDNPAFNVTLSYWSEKYEEMIMERDSIVAKEKHDAQLQIEHSVSEDDLGGL